MHRVRYDERLLLKDRTGDHTVLGVQGQDDVPDPFLIQSHCHLAFEDILLLIDQIEAGPVEADTFYHPFENEPENFVDIEGFHQSGILDADGCLVGNRCQHLFFHL